jgi:SAM-dependent methyltransferase
MNEQDFHDHHYESEAGRIRGSAIFAHAYDRSARDFLASTGMGRAHRVLSLGCGDGAIERRLAPHLGEIVGVDISPVAIAQARTTALEAGLTNVTFVASDAGALNLDAYGQFDCVAAFAFLHHLPEAAIATVLREARKVLRPGGAFYSFDPSTRRFIRLFVGLVRKTYDRHHSPDERELDPEHLTALVREAGFATSSIDYVDYFFSAVTWLAPGTPGWLGTPLVALDAVALNVPVARRFASSFSLTARSRGQST